MTEVAINRPGAGFNHCMVEVFGHAVHYAEAGKGADVFVFCPGSAGVDMSWAKDELARSMRVIELNPPGWGGTEPLAHKIDQRDIAHVLLAALEVLGIERFYLNGASMGGVNALWIAALRPDRVIALSLEGGMNFAREEHLVSPEAARKLREMVEKGDAEGTGYPVAAPHPRKPWADDAFVRHQMRKRIPMMRMVTNAHEDALERQTRTMRTPILVMLGEHDELLKPNHLDRWYDIAPTASRMLLPNAYHDIQNTEPDQFLHLVREMMRRYK